MSGRRGRVALQRRDPIEYVYGFSLRDSEGMEVPVPSGRMTIVDLETFIRSRPNIVDITFPSAIFEPYPEKNVRIYFWSQFIGNRSMRSLRVESRGEFSKHDWSAIAESAAVEANALEVLELPGVPLDVIESVLERIARRRTEAEGLLGGLLQKTMRVELWNDSQYEMCRPLEKLGNGFSGEVYVAENIATGERVAAKVNWLEGRAVQEMQMELLFRHAGLDCPSVMRIKGLFVLRPGGRDADTQNFEKDGSDRIVTVMDLMLGGDLEHASRDTTGTKKITFTHSLELLLELTDALDCVHAHGVAHADVHAGNIFLTENREHAKLGDFGFVTRKGGTPQGDVRELIVTWSEVMTGDFIVDFLSMKVESAKSLFRGVSTARDLRGKIKELLGREAEEKEYESLVLEEEVIAKLERFRFFVR